MMRKSESEVAPSERMIETVSLEEGKQKRHFGALSPIPKADLRIHAQRLIELLELPGEFDLFYKAALVARDANAFEEIDELAESDKGILRHEKEHKWHLARPLWFTIAVCSIGAAVHGWDQVSGATHNRILSTHCFQTGSNGANLAFPTEFGIAGDSAHDKWLVGLINSGPTIATLLM